MKRCRVERSALHRTWLQRELSPSCISPAINFRRCIPVTLVAPPVVGACSPKDKVALRQVGMEVLGRSHDDACVARVVVERQKIWMIQLSVEKLAAEKEARRFVANVCFGNHIQEGCMGPAEASQVWRRIVRGVRDDMKLQLCR